MIREPNEETRRELRPYLESSGSLDYAWEQARLYANRAADVLDILPETAAKGLLRNMSQYVVRRSA
jgi:octaprenyl-diphosphate synthase